MTPEDHLEAWLQGLELGDDPELAHTPERVTRLLRSFAPKPPPRLSTFPAPGGAPVVLRELPFHSLCAHHLLPFFGTATVAYLPGATVGGFSGIARALQVLARRPQLQERLAEQLADHLAAELEPRGLALRLRARQLCMEMQGASSPGTVETWAHRGAWQELQGLFPA